MTQICSASFKLLVLLNYVTWLKLVTFWRGKTQKKWKKNPTLYRRLVLIIHQKNRHRCSLRRNSKQVICPLPPIVNRLFAFPLQTGYLLPQHYRQVNCSLHYRQVICTCICFYFSCLLLNVIVLCEPKFTPLPSHPVKNMIIVHFGKVIACPTVKWQQMPMKTNIVAECSCSSCNLH